MLEVKNKTAVQAGVSESRSVHIFLETQLYCLTGKWEWELQTHHLFCSDVIFALHQETDLPGTKCLLYPEDLSVIRDMVNRSLAKQSGEYRFRVITTYGSVIWVHGLGSFEMEVQQDFEDRYVHHSLENHIRQKMMSRQLEEESVRLSTHHYAENIIGYGIWYFNTNTHETFFSDEVFRIHGLPPQGLNAHFHTFTSFIHPDDKAIVTQALENAYREQLPLNLEYRVLLPDRQVKFISYTTHWSFNNLGERVISGLVRDITLQRQQDHQSEKLHHELKIRERMLRHTEGVCRLASWHMNLLTRKIVYANEVYRIYGLKPSPVPLNAELLLKYVHLEDRERVNEMNHQILSGQAPSAIEYRIVRPDGKIKYLRQSGKLLVDIQEEPVMIGTIVDISDQKMVDRKLKEARSALELQRGAYSLVEEKSGVGHWAWNMVSGEISWSRGIYELLGFRMGGEPLTPSLLVGCVQVEDRELFQEKIALMLKGTPETDFSFRINRKNEVRYLHAFFRVMIINEKSFFMATLQDKTGDVLLEQKVSRLAGMVEILADTSMDRIFVTDLNNYILRWNRKCEEAYGIKKEKAIGQNFFDLFPQWRTQEVAARFQQLLKGETILLKDQRGLAEGRYENLIMVSVRDENQNVAAVLTAIQDITQEYELRKQLEDRLQFIEKLLEASVDRVIVLDKNMNYLYWNRKAEQYYGIRKEEVIGKNILELFPGFIDDPSYGEFRKVLKGETIHIPALRNLKEKKGYFETYLIPIQDEKKDEVNGVLWVVHDLEGEYHLAQQQRKANQILQSINEAYVEVDFHANIMYMNPRAEAFWNISKEKALGKNLLEVFPESRKSEAWTALSRAIREKKDVCGEYYGRVAKRWVYLSCTVTAESVIILFYDITGAKKAEHDLQEKNKVLEAIYNASLTGIQVLRAIRDEAQEVLDFEWTYVTKSIEDFIGAGSLIGRKSFELLPTGRHDGLFEKYRTVLETGVTSKFEHHYRGEGFDHWFEVIAIKHNDGLVLGINDISGRKKVEEELRKNNNLLRQAEDLIRMGTWTYEIATGQFKWSDGMYQLFGLNKEKVLHPEIYVERALEDDRGAAGRIVKYLKQDHLPFEETLHIKRKGVPRLLKVKASVWKNEKGEAEKLVGVDIDITDMEQAGNEMMESQNLLQQTTLATPDAITVYDLENKRPTYLNSCLSEWTGCTREELVSMEMEGRLSLIHQEDQPKLLRFNKDMLQAGEGEIHTMEYRLKTREGKTIWVRNRSKVFKRDREGKVTHILSVLQDFTKEVELRMELIERTRYAEAIIDSSIDRMFVYDTDFTILAWNRRSEEVMGLKREEAIGKNLKDLFPRLWADEMISNAFHKALEGELIYLPAKKAIYAEGYYERFFIPLKNNEERTYAVLTIVHDVSEMVSQSEELKQLNKTLEKKNKELEEKNEEVSSFAFVASHDLKEPLRKLYTFSDWLLQKEEENLSETGKGYLKKIVNSVRRMDMLIEDVLVLAKIDADRRPPSSVDLRPVLERVIGEMKDVLRVKEAEIIIGDLPVIKGNGSQLFYLFKNLLDNAIKFQLPGSHPVVKIAASKTDALALAKGRGIPDEAYYCISFQDNGLGFENKYAQKIFRIFQRLHTGSDYEGTGMGLAICRKIMENHGGYIRAHSELGKGAVFSCYFPVPGRMPEDPS
ncbi:MAG: PAS domain S-box protein [Flavisolibacter sp.]